MQRNRPKRVQVDYLYAVSISAAATLQIGDVQSVVPRVKARAFGGERGAPSFTAGAAAIYQESILHFVNHRDSDQNDMNILWGNLPEPVSRRRR